MEGFECHNPLVVPPLIEPAGHRPLQAVDLGFQSGVPGDLPTLPQTVLQAYFILNARRYRRPLVVTWATFGSRCCHSLQDGGGAILNACVDCHPIVQFRIERNMIFLVSLEVGPIGASEIRAIRWVVKDERHAVSLSSWRWSELSAEQEVRYTWNGMSFVIAVSKTSGVAEGLYGLVVGVSGPKIRQEFSLA